MAISDSTFAAEGFLRPGPGLLTGGQPRPAQWTELASAGVRTVINLRPDAELADRDEAVEVREAGLAYRHLPVDGTADLTVENAVELARAMIEGEPDILVHCGSGNRVGALLAIAKGVAGTPLEEALDYGRSAGMTSAEAHVRSLLQAGAGAAMPW